MGKRFFVFNGNSGLGRTEAVVVDEGRSTAYFMYRDAGDSRWYWGIQNSKPLDKIEESNLPDYVRLLVGNPFPIFMEFEGESAKAFGLVRDSEAMIKALAA